MGDFQQKLFDQLKGIESKNHTGLGFGREDPYAPKYSLSDKFRKENTPPPSRERHKDRREERGERHDRSSDRDKRRQKEDWEDDDRKSREKDRRSSRSKDEDRSNRSPKRRKSDKRSSSRSPRRYRRESPSRQSRSRSRSRERHGRRRDKSPRGGSRVSSEERECRHKSSSDDRRSGRKQAEEDRRRSGEDRESSTLPEKGERGKPKKAAKAQPKWDEVIPGYEKMSEPEKMKARTKYKLSQVASKDKNLSEREGWERFNLNKDAFMDEDGDAHDKIDFSNVDGGDYIGRGEADEEAFMKLRTFDVLKKRTEPSLSEADKAHAAAIFGRKPPPSTHTVLTNFPTQQTAGPVAPEPRDRGGGSDSDGSTKGKGKEEDVKNILSTKVLMQQRRREMTWLERIEAKRKALAEAGEDEDADTDAREKLFAPESKEPNSPKSPVSESSSSEEEGATAPQPKENVKQPPRPKMSFSLGAKIF